jgi:aspartate kinase
MDAREIVKTDAVFGAANPDEARSASAINPLKTLLNEGQIPVIGGYIGEAPDGRPTTLGFEGSDVTATFLGALLGAESVTIWTDVDGVYSCDPRVVPNARRLDTLTFAQAEKMASCGAKVLHPNTLKPVSGRGIPVWVRNLFAPARGGTLISGGTSSGTSSGTPSGTHSSIPSESPSESPSTLAFRSEVRVDGDTKKPGQRIPGQRIPGQRVSVMGLSLQRWERVRDHAARVAEDFRYSEKDQFLSAWIPEEEMENRIQILYHLLCS